MKPRKFEKLLLIESRNKSKIDFKGKCDIFIETIYLKLSEILKVSFSFNYNFNPKEEI